MVVKKKIIALKYARAYLNLYFDALQDHHVQAIADLQRFVRANVAAIAYLNLPGISDELWPQFLEKVKRHFVLPDSLYHLMSVLRERQKLMLLPHVMDALLQEFWQWKRVLHFDITSSHPLEEHQKESLIAFLTKKTGAAQIKATFAVDASLICGICLRSETYMFEHSVARELDKFKESLLQRVRL